MADILLFLAEGFEEIEALTVVDLLRRAGQKVTMVSISSDAEVTGSHGIKVTADEVIDRADFDSADMLVLPGGMPGTANLENCKALTDRIMEYDAKGKRIAAICAAPSILAHLGILKGREAVCHPSFEKEMRDAVITDTECAESDHIITGRGMGCAIPFSLRLIERLCGADKAKEISDAIVYEVYRQG